MSPALKGLEKRYEIRRLIGRGGMGVVYGAWDTVLHREVALKTVLDAPDEDAIRMFRKESRLLAALNHANVVEIYDFGETDVPDSKPYFVMPLLAGKTVGKLIEENPKGLPLGQAIEIVCQTCRGLAAAHD